MIQSSHIEGVPCVCCPETSKNLEETDLSILLSASPFLNAFVYPLWLALLQGVSALHPHTVGDIGRCACACTCTCFVSPVR